METKNAWGEANPERVPWATARDRLTGLWKPGEHFGIIGMNGSGKTYLALRGLVPMRAHVLVLDPKQGDDTLTRYGGRTLRRAPSRWDLLMHGDEPVLRIAPLLKDAPRVFYAVINDVWKKPRPVKGEETWTLYLDEVRMLAQMLPRPGRSGATRLGPVETLLTAGRSRGITVIGTTQAPRFVPGEFYTENRWFAFGRVRDRRALKRFGEIGGDTDMIEDTVPYLAEHEFLITSPGFAVITKFRGGKK